MFLVRRGANIPHTLVEIDRPRRDAIRQHDPRLGPHAGLSADRPGTPDPAYRNPPKGLTRIVVNVGYLQRVNLPSLIAGDLQSFGVDAENTVYIVGLERPVSPPIFSRPLGLFFFAYATMARLALRPADRFNLPPTRTLELGMPRYL